MRALIEPMRKIVLLLVDPDRRTHRVVGPAILSRAEGPMDLLAASSREEAIAKAGRAPAGALFALAPSRAGAPLLDALREGRPDVRPFLYDGTLDVEAFSRTLWDVARGAPDTLSSPAAATSAPRDHRPA